MKIYRRTLLCLCVLTLCGILAAGLWPFNPHPKNEVSWLGNENGLLFGDYGTIMSASPFRAVNPGEELPCSFEIWLEPGATYDSNVIAAFYTRENPHQFRLGQTADNLYIRRSSPDGKQSGRMSILTVNHVFRQGKRLHVVVSSDKENTTIYVNGMAAQESREFYLTNRNFTGELVIGNSPEENNSWNGKLRGIAIYDQALGVSEVSEHFDAWAREGRVEIAEHKTALAIYPFDERTGSTVHNRAGSGPDLNIPPYYTIYDPMFLEPPWREFRANWDYCKDVIENIAAFIPLGLFFCAYLSTVLRFKHAILIAVILGGMVSLTIEVLQAFLPMRDSGMTDIITNTTGAAIGAILYGSRFAQELLAKIGAPTQRQTEIPLE